LGQWALAGIVFRLSRYAIASEVVDLGSMKAIKSTDLPLAEPVLRKTIRSSIARADFRKKPLLDLLEDGVKTGFIMDYLSKVMPKWQAGEPSGEFFGCHNNRNVFLLRDILIITGTDGKRRLFLLLNDCFLFCYIFTSFLEIRLPSFSKIT
jgi:hypothetical protein